MLIRTEYEAKLSLMGTAFGSQVSRWNTAKSQGISAIMKQNLRRRWTSAANVTTIRQESGQIFQPKNPRRSLFCHWRKCHGGNLKFTYSGEKLRPVSLMWRHFAAGRRKPKEVILILSTAISITPHLRSNAKHWNWASMSVKTSRQEPSGTERACWIN